jgi:DNA-binding MarR family transcriptional regulator
MLEASTPHTREISTMKQAITPRQKAFLDKLREKAKGEASFGEMAKMMGVSKNAVTTMTDRLVKAGYVKRIPPSSECRLRLIGGKAS